MGGRHPAKSGYVAILLQEIVFSDTLIKKALIQDLHPGKVMLNKWRYALH